MPLTPSESEQEFFARQELERRRQVAQEREAKLQVAERQKLKDQHWMRCPKCGMELAELDYRGIKIDQCSSCNGIWLDAGELDVVAAGEKGGFMHSLHMIFKP